MIPPHHVFSPTCEPGEPPKPAPVWQDVSKERARAHMKAGGGILVAGTNGVDAHAHTFGKRFAL